MIASLNSARTKARDARRIADLKQIQTAIEMFYADKGRYPGALLSEAYYFVAYPYPSLDCGNAENFSQGNWCNLETLLSPYIGKLPRDTSLDYRYAYKYNPVVDMYGLLVVLDGQNSTAINDGGFYNDRFEIGPLVSYCKNKYTGNNANWNYWSYTDACVGGS